MKILNLATALVVTSLVPLAASAASDTDHQKTAAEYSADNSGKNQRDRAATELTAQDQSNVKSDVEITRLIRKSVVDEKNLSTSAHNVKIIVAKNAVTLKGPVKTAEEKDIVASKARAIAPHMKINNELEVKVQ